MDRAGERGERALDEAREQLRRDDEREVADRLGEQAAGGPVGREEDPSRALFTASRRFARSVRSASVRRAFRWAAVRIRGAPGWLLIVSA